MSDEKTFEREVLDRLIKVETLLERVVGTCPTCQAKIQLLEIGQAKTDESAKSAHKRIDGVYKTATGISVGVGFVLQVIAYIVQVTKGGGH